jgi:hypothetical protein
MLSFPNGLHDDIVDTISNGAIEFTKGRPSATPEPKAKPLPTVQEKIAAQLKARQKKPTAKSARKALMR